MDSRRYREFVKFWVQRFAAFDGPGKVGYGGFIAAFAAPDVGQ